MSTWMRLTVAFVLLCHAFIYIRIGAMLPGAIKAWQDRSWLLGDRLTGAPLATVVMAMAAFVVFWDGRPGMFVEEDGIGAVVSGMLLAATLLFPDAFR
jgi:hypothetical protein